VPHCGAAARRPAMSDTKPPWTDCPKCPQIENGEPCNGPGLLQPYNPSGWYGPQDATLFCHACGTGWYGSDDEIERALIAECWWDAFSESNLSEIAFRWATCAEPLPCGKTCFRRGCQQPHMHFGRNAKVCPKFPKCLGGPCARCVFLLDATEKREARETA
jgi:hypothetical protein